jgi:hypothetical protein
MGRCNKSIPPAKDTLLRDPAVCPEENYTFIRDRFVCLLRGISLVEIRRIEWNNGDLSRALKA